MNVVGQLGLRTAAKAYFAALGAVVTFFIGVLDPTATGFNAFAGVTTVQWLTASTVALGTFGITWSVPNKPAVPSWR